MSTNIVSWLSKSTPSHLNERELTSRSLQKILGIIEEAMNGFNPQFKEATNKKLNTFKKLENWHKPFLELENFKFFFISLLNIKNENKKQ